jgi:SAM-dependent methyltransferase
VDKEYVIDEGIMAGNKGDRIAREMKRFLRRHLAVGRWWRSISLSYRRENIENSKFFNNKIIKCNLCGHAGNAVYKNQDAEWISSLGIDLLRENITCQKCKGSARYRALGLIVSRACQDFDKISPQASTILDTDPFSKLQPLFINNNNYKRSGYSPGIKSGGELAPGITCVDLQQIPFPDDSLNLLISSDVIEHIDNDTLSFQEAFRVLRPGGKYIFTVPFAAERMVTQIRAFTTQDGTVVHRHPVQVHGDLQGGILARRIYGRDLVQQLEACGFKVWHHLVVHEESGIFGVDVFEAEKVKPTDC